MSNRPTAPYHPSDPASRLARPFFGFGVLGSYTTFSAVAAEVSLLANQGRTATCWSRRE